MDEKSGVRRDSRVPAAERVLVTWRDREGNEKFAYAQTVDVSEFGMRIQVPEPLPERGYVTFRADSLDLQGTASVRSCVRKGAKYLAGLEFSGGLRWEPKS